MRRKFRARDESKPRGDPWRRLSTRKCGEKGVQYTPSMQTRSVPRLRLPICDRLKKCKKCPRGTGEIRRETEGLSDNHGKGKKKEGREVPRGPPWNQWKIYYQTWCRGRNRGKKKRCDKIYGAGAGGARIPASTQGQKKNG